DLPREGRSPGDVTAGSWIVPGRSATSVAVGAEGEHRMTAGAFPADGPWVERWLSTPRFAVYVRACDGDRTRAIMLYQWNAATSQAFGGDLGHLEVALRNAYDTAITTRWGDSQHWLLDPGSPVRRPLIRHGIDHNGRRRAQIAE